MAEALLGPIIEKLVIELLVNETKLLKGIHNEVESLKDELLVIAPLLNDAEVKIEKEESGDAIKAWIKLIRKSSSRVEDIIDEYRYYIMQHQQHEKSGFCGSIRRACHVVKTLKVRCGLASKIQNVNHSLRKIKDMGQGFGLRPLEQGFGATSIIDDKYLDPRLRALFIKEDEVIGIEGTKKELIEKLVKGSSELLVISLIGEGGIGKTTLAKKVFDDVEVIQHFKSVHEWITVSRPYKLMSVLKKLKEKICKGEEYATRETDIDVELIECVKKCLQKNRYVIVFDDVWEENFWDDIKLALPDNSDGSRVIITTRNSAVSDSSKEASHYFIHLNPWSPSLAWELFCKKAFRNESQQGCPEELMKLSIEIVTKCQGLPLVIATIAGLLATKEKDVSEWEKIKNDLNSNIGSNSQLTRVQKTLSLGYYDLPYPVRSCFLYFGIFPEDYSIADEMLYRLWIAEGLIKTKGNQTAEKVAEEYLREMIKRNLVLFDQGYWVGEGNFLHVHDLMREVILSKADELNFSQVWDEKESRFRGEGRRLAIFGSAEHSLKNVKHSGTRSLFLYNIMEELTKPSKLSNLLKMFKLLEVLDVENVLIETLPRELGNLLCLKYLSLRNTKIKFLPKSISKLHHLQSLDIRNTLVVELPKEVNKLKNLHHILAYRYNYNYTSRFDYIVGVKVEEGLGDLENLQTLTLVDVHLSGVSVIKEIEKLTKLRWLGLLKLTTATMNALCAALGKIHKLERLYLATMNENEVINLQYLSSPPHFLRDLMLHGQLEKLPEWFPKLQNIFGLCLSSSKLTDESIKFLKGLRNLETLQLSVQAYEGEELHFEEGGFPKLKRLSLYKLEKLKVVKIDRGALPILELLQISYCLLLEKVSSDQDLRNIAYIHWG